MKPKVYFFSARTHEHQQSLSKVKGPTALAKLGIGSKLNKGDNAVIKTHFGAEENVRYLRPSYIRFLCDYVKELGGYPSVAESCGWGAPEEFTGKHTEYSGRATEKEYLEVAKKHGFSEETMGAPLLMLDGPQGTDIEFQGIDGKIFEEVLVAGRLREFEHVILATHFKGHSNSGFGGAIKNLGIGCVSKGGKVRAHTGMTFDIDFNAPIEKFKRCLEVCPTGALSEKDGKLHRDEEKCRYCYMCSSVCEDDVIDLGESPREEFVSQMVDNAVGVLETLKDKQVYYLNYAIDITYQCDCSGGSDVPFVTDIGVLSSLDPVAVDQAFIDLVHLSSMNPHSVLGDMKNLPKEEKEVDWFSYIPRFSEGEIDLNEEGEKSTHWELQLKFAEEIGLGTRKYELVEVPIETKDNP